MFQYLFDTNIISELYKLGNSRIDTNVRQWLETIKPSQTNISCITLSEIKTGILLKARKDPIQAERLNHWFTHNVLSVYQAKSFSINNEIALLASEYHIPNKMDLNDAYIAATAKYHNLVLVTRNLKDFNCCDIRLFNPFEPN
ncbi:PilT protein-like protein [Actinobacillus pleuropneumoniae serovar 3 str. JL03]|uniref:PilT protein-like protein n=1 Tax=Actinobacillus pleuropneumoniae serotype 3 (strain JL03) TaxID=434271 RepID=B0BT00_ACTPJ|nr:PilT protein-like protein [Actinobacillus pleuropneumoniae serovar 3 str. JL03]UKH15326.1 type II toxin-antitoxin system VapC family toxin [Actinobacillus pleuropneumoniae]UKH44504.1 type II toxin-antitoxin system VapC family toxin [Actinobacillus pleuropneumoniae]